MTVAAGHRIRRSGLRLAVGREYFPSRGSNEVFYPNRDPVVPEIVIERFMDDFHRVVLRVGADIRDGDDGPYPGVNVLVAHAGSEEYADDDFQGRRAFCPPEQPLEKP